MYSSGNALIFMHSTCYTIIKYSISITSLAGISSLNLTPTHYISCTELGNLYGNDCRAYKLNGVHKAGKLSFQKA